MLRPGDRAHAVNAAGKATGTAHSPMSGIAKSAMVSTNVSDKVSDSVRAASNTAAGPAPAPLPPSRYLAERMLSTAERLVLTSTHRTEIIEFTEPPTEMNQRDFRVPIDEPVFKPLPAEVVLQNCVPFQTYEVLLSFRNVDKFPRKLKIEPIASPVLSVHGWKVDSLHTGKIAAGMEVPFVLKFTPTDDADFAYNLVCTTDREKFIVPIRVISSRALLDFPDAISFGECPVRYETKKTLLVRNVGQRAAKFHIECDGPFRVEPAQGFIGENETKQMDVYFEPLTTGSFESAMIIVYDTKERVAVQLSGISEDVLVKLEQNQLKLDSTYISLSSFGTAKIVNKSNVMCSYRWKAFATDEEEQQERERATAKMEFEELAKRVQSGNMDGASKMLQDRKLTNLCRQIEHDPLLFDDGLFVIEPKEGVVWPNSEVKVNVIFRPQAAAKYVETLYCEITGRETRLPLQILGEAFGPHVQFSFEILDAGENFINSPKDFEVTLENTGDIDARYALIPLNTAFSSKFAFTPSSGLLKVGEQQKITIHFESDILGDFCEEFVWELEGSPDPMVFRIKGRVIGPTFHFDCDELDFAKCSYGFATSRSLRLYNTSSIPMTYELQLMSSSGAPAFDDEFGLVQAAGTLSPGENHNVTVEFRPRHIKKYALEMSVAIDGVGSDLFSLPIRAESVVPMVVVKQSVIDYGDCCIGYCYSKNIELENLSDFPARFQVLAQPDEAKTSFAYHVDSCGSANDDVTTIPARTVQLIKLNVEVRRMGHADFPVFIQLVGKEEMPLVLDVSARGVGPKVHLSASSLDWGKIPVLESKTMTLTLRNDSRIPTAFECALPRDGSVFKVVPMIGTIPPGETIAVQVTALLDDTVIFSELLKVTVHMGSVYDVALHAKGLGSTIRIKESIEDVDFSSVFSNQACRRRVTVVNHGRRMQTLVWTHGGEKRISSKQQPEVTYFRVQPARLTLYPGEEQVVEIIGLSDIAQRVSETISCFGYYEKNPTKYLILKAELAANFIDPVVSFTPSTLHFLCDTYRQTNAPVSVESVQITNVTGLPLNMCLQTTSPFAVDNAQSSYELAPGETMSAHVSFGRGVVQPKCAVTEQGRLAISFRDHRQKSFVDLVGKYTFPSVIVDKTAVDFGYCLPYTEQHRVVTIRNPGDKSLNYHWSFSLDGHDATDTETVAQSFDIHPIRGTIAPGATEAATVIFYGGSFGATRITAVCSVENGPEYGIQVRGNCSPMEFHVDKSLIDFGSRPFAEINLQDFNIVNDSDVAVDFDIRLPPGSTLANRVSIVPREGRIAARDKQGVTINFCAGVPEMIDAQFFVHVAHLEPRAVRVTAKGTAPRCRVDLPKILTAEQSEMVSEQENVVRELNVLLPAMHPVNIPGWKPINVDDILDEHLAVDVSQHEHQHMIRANERVLKRLSDDLTRRSRISSHTPQLNNFLGSPILHHKTFQLLGGIKKTVQNFVELNKTVAEKYRCDFGYVVRNAVQKLTFSVFNTGANPMTIFVDKSALQGTGFEVAVDKIRNLAPQESQQLEVTFNSRAIPDGGLAAAELRLEAFNGFAYVVELRAQVVVPDVVLSADSLDFGNVHLGQRRVMHLRLVNPHPVPCDWSIGKAAPAAMDKAPKQNARQAAAAAILLAEQHMGTVFTVSSLSGKLAIGEKFDICVTFTPEADMEYALVLPVHISTNKRALSVSVRGRGASLKLAIEPHSLNFGTVAPFDGVERKFTISNHSELPLEVFSADLDGQFLEEELVLNVWNQYIQGRTYILPRGIGHGLPQEFVEYAARKNESLMGATVSPAIKALTDDATTLPVSVPLLGLDAPTNLQTNPHQMEPSSLVANQLRDNNMDESHDAHATTVSSADALYIVLHGAPFAGKSSHAKRLSAAYGIPILRLDDMFDALRKSSIPGGSNFAHGVHRKSMTKLSAAEVNNVVDAKRPGVFPGGEKQRGGNGSFSSDFVDGAQAFGEENLFEKLRAVLSGASYSRGFIVDGIESRYFPHTGMLAKFLCEFVGPTACVHFFLLTVEPQIMREREAAHEAARKMKERAVRNCIREIDEDLYDALPSVALERYERVLNVMKTQRKQFLQHFGQKRRDGAASAKSDANKSAADDEKSKKKDKIRRRNKSVMKSAGGGGGSSVDPKESGANGKASAIGKKDRNVLSIDEEVSTVASGQKGGVVTIPFGNGSPDSPEFEEMQVVLGENLLTMYESYVETLESFVSVIRDVDKVSSHTLRTIAAKLAPQDPKKQAKSKANAAASAITAIPASVSVAAADLPNGSNKQLVESDLIIADNAAAIKFREIATIQQTIDTVYDELRAMLPRVRDQKTASDNADSDAIPVAFTQEIVLAPVPVNAHTREEIKALFAVAHAKLDIASGAIDEGEPRVAGGTPSLHSALRHSEQSAVCRWVVQPGTTKDLTIRFSPVRVGTWNHTLRFGVLGYAGLKSIDCQAACCYPSIGLHPEERTTRSRSTRKSTRQTPAVEVVPTRTYDFGPLLCGKLKDKSVEKQMENRENRATFTITNMSTIADIKVFFFLKTDPRGEIFSIDPPNLDLDAGQTSTLTVFAYPKTPGQFEETIICCIKDNPEPLVLRVTCAGAKPELELDKKIVQFEKLLLGRSDSRDLKITNLSALNVAWKLVGMETLVEDFDIKPVEGIIGPNAIETVKIGFQSCKPGSIKRSLKLEVSDPERVTGIAQTENISIVAESYDVTVDVHFPRSIENGIDFGVCRVDEESKHSCLLRNKGKYEIGFKFETDWKELASCLTVSPSHGTVAASDKPVTVQLLFKSGQETLIRDNTSLKCSIIEPATGEVIGIVPVKLSAKAVYSKHVITPVRELAFGASVLGTKTTRTFTIENTGEFDFKFAISTADRQSAAREASLRGKADQSKHHLKKEVVKQQVDNLTVGPFVVFPANGVVQIGGKQQLVVEFQAETADSFEELIEVDISDRSSDLKGGAIEYRLLGETCVPGIQNQDFMSIFEEHTVVKKLDQFINTNNVFAEDDRCFSFGPLLVATSSQARLKLRNPFKVPCEVTLSLKMRARLQSAASGGGGTGGSVVSGDTRVVSKQDGNDILAFEIEPKFLKLAPHESQFVVVSFHPQALVHYSAHLEAAVENTASEHEFKTLGVELRGEGTLPHVTVESPVLRGKGGTSLLKFRRTICGQSMNMPVVLKNDGIIPAKLKFEWTGTDVGTVFLSPELDAIHTILPGENATINIAFAPRAVRKYECDVKLRVLDNVFEDAMIQFIGEGFNEEFSFNNLPLDSENEIRFGPCRVGEVRTVNFLTANHSSETMRFSWQSSSNEFVISPSLMHVRPHETKEVTVSVCPRAPSDAITAKMVCSLAKIRCMSTPLGMDWDNRQRGATRAVVDSKTGRLVTMMTGNLVGSGDSRKNQEYQMEPAYEVLTQLADQQLIISASADVPSYDCDQGKISFRPTLMFQTRVFKFPLRNNGKVPLVFRLYFEDQGRPVALDDGHLPFVVEPTHGTVEAGESAIVCVRFSPMDVDEYEYVLRCVMPGIAPSVAERFAIPVSGSSLRPICHFELPESDYLMGRRTTDSNMPQFDEATRVIEFETCGVSSKTTKRFYIINPTDFNYDFEWKCVDGPQSTDVFRCTTEKGLVQSGKKFEIVFEFTPEAIETKESLWKFCIPSQNIEVQFLLVGFTSEPNVFFDRTGVNFKSVLVGRQLKEVVKIKNTENMPFAFSFDGASNGEVRAKCDSALQFNPSTGIVPALGETAVTVTFQPPTERSYNYNATCFVRKKPGALVLNIKGEGYEIQEKIVSELADSSQFELVASPGVDNVLDFGMLQVNERKSKRVVISNHGKVAFDFRWTPDVKTNGLLSIHPEFGSVGKEERVVCELVFLPSAPMQLKPARMQCAITNGRTYHVSVYGTGRKPPLRLSQTEHDFGPHFLGGDGSAEGLEKSITLKNDDNRLMAVSVVPREKSCFDMPCSNFNLMPGEEKNMVVRFVPLAVGRISERVQLEVNGLSKIDLFFKGEGAEFDVDLASHTLRNINFGALRVGHSLQKTVKLVNKSIIPATFQVGPRQALDRLKECDVDLTLREGAITLQPKATCLFDVRYAPRHRRAPFNEELFVLGPGNIRRPLLMITGTCQGVDVKLESEFIAFGAIVHKSSTIRKLQILNTGDIGVRYRWDVTQFHPDFTISPAEGYISAGMDAALEIVFNPLGVKSDIRYEQLVCEIEGGRSLNLTLTGSCILAPMQNEVLKFNVPVRQSESKSVTITNKTTMNWHVRPVIEGTVWSGADIVDIEPGQSKAYEITYTPLAMTSTDGPRHEGSLFFPLPDGTGILYKLTGVAEKPAPEQSISRDIVCKTLHIESLVVTNWMKHPQRFHVTFEVQKPDPSTTIKGFDFLDVPGESSRDYKINIYAYKEGITNVKVTFKNEHNQEYLFFLLALKATSPGTFDVLEFTTPVRRLLTKAIAVENPLAVPVSFTTTVSSTDVFVPHTFTVPAKSIHSMDVEFLPLHVKECVTRLSLTSIELGVYHYDLKMNATVPKPERSLQFKVGLGSSQTQTLRFMSYSRSKVEYTCKLESTDFVVEKTVIAHAATSTAGVEVSLEVTYEPSKLGDLRTALFLTSSAGGDFVCPLFGHCSLPRPQGPVTIKASTGGASIVFKNVFAASSTFTFAVDNPSFAVKPSETVAGKKSVTIVVNYKAQNAVKTAKLTISHPSGTTWVYYIKAL